MKFSVVVLVVCFFFGIFCVEEIIVEESFDEGENWLKRGEIKWKRSGGKFFPEDENGLWNKGLIQNANNYYIRFLKGDLILLKKRVSVCDLIESDFEEKVIVHGKKDTKYVEYELPSTSEECKKIRKKKVQQKMSVKSTGSFSKEFVDIRGFQKQVEEKVNQPSSGGGLVGLFKRYWKYIIPGIIIFFVIQIVGLLCSGELEKMMEQKGK